MSPATASHDSRLAEVFEFQNGQIVQELGYDDDVDLDIRDAIEDVIDADLEDEDSQEIVDAVIVWFRKDDGDLVDYLQDALGALVAGGPVWVLAPKPGRPGHVEPADVVEAADLAGLRAMNAVSLSTDWSGTRLASRA